MELQPLEVWFITGSQHLYGEETLRQAAHGDREFGYICTRIRKARKVIVGHWQEEEIQKQLAVWERAAAGLHELRNLRIARFGDNMRHVAVTEGDKVEAQLRFGVDLCRRSPPHGV